MPLVVKEVTPNFGARITEVATDGVRLLATQPSSGVAVLTAPGGTPTLSTLTPPLAPYVIDVTAAGAIVTAGLTASVQPGGTTAIAINDTSVVLGSAAAGTVTMLTGTDPLYQAQTPVGGLAGVVALAWSADDQQVLAATTAGVAILTLTTGVLAVTQTLTETGVTAIAVTLSGDQALLCQPAANQVSVLTNDLHTWAIGTPVALTGVRCVAIISDVRAIVGTGTGISYLARAGALWSIEGATSVVIGAPVTALTSDGLTGFYAATAGGLYHIGATGALTHMASWTGAGSSITFQQGQIAVLDAASLLIRWFDLTGAPRGTTAVGAGASSLTEGPVSLWVTEADGAHQLSPYGPFALRAQGVGIVAASADGVTWGTQQLGVGFTPSAIAFDGTNVLMLTQQNDLLTFDASALPTLGAPTIVTIGTYEGQGVGVWLGLSALVAARGSVYAPTSASGRMAVVA
jgi:hypothetical protein